MAFCGISCMCDCVSMKVKSLQGLHQEGTEAKIFQICVVCSEGPFHAVSDAIQHDRNVYRSF